MKQWTKVVKMINIFYSRYIFPIRYTALEVIKQTGSRMLELLIQAIHFLTCLAALTDINTEKWRHHLCLTPKICGQLLYNMLWLWRQAAHSSEMIVSTYNAVWCHNQECHSYDTVVFLTVYWGQSIYQSGCILKFSSLPFQVCNNVSLDSIAVRNYIWLILLLFICTKIIISTVTLLLTGYAIV